MDGVVPAGEGLLRSGGGVWSRVRARFDLCVGGGDGPNSGHGPCGWSAALDPVGQAEHGHSQVVARLLCGDLGQGAGWGLVPWLEDAPEDPVLGGGVPYCPWWGGPWGEHGVCPFDEPLQAGGCSRSGYHVVVPAMEDCNPDLRQGVVTVCRWQGEVVVLVRRPAARRAVSRVGAVACTNCSGRFGSAGWSFSAGARRRRTVPRRMTLMPVSCVRAWPHSMGGIKTCCPWVCLRARQSTRSTMASWRPLSGVVRSQRALTVSLVQSSDRRYQPRRVVGALSWRVARRRSGSRMVAGVRGGCPGSWGGWMGWMGCRGLARLRRHMVGPGWARPCWAVPGGFLGEGWDSGRCGGVLEACGWGWGSRAGRGVG